ncbi:hypothetical protein KC220_25625, partial [Mycobacterium tuberculosis]|nr:hypothetical protein [Mycobacterium tuberculosis]
MTHGSPSFTIKLKTHKVKKLFHKRFISKTLKSTQLVNRVLRPFVDDQYCFIRIVAVGFGAAV